MRGDGSEMWYQSLPVLEPLLMADTLPSQRWGPTLTTLFRKMSISFGQSLLWFRKYAPFSPFQLSTMF